MILGYSQKEESSLLEYITCNLPDTIYGNDFIKEDVLKEIKNSWIEYEKGNLQVTNWPNEGAIFTNYYFLWEKKQQGSISLCIDPINNLYKIYDGSQWQVKLFENGNELLVGVSSNYDAHECWRQDLTVFYLFKDNIFLLQTDSIYKYFGDELITFTESDTVLLIRDYSNINLLIEYGEVKAKNGEEGLIQLGADPETGLLITKYIMENGKLRLAE